MSKSWKFAIVLVSIVIILSFSIVYFKIDLKVYDSEVFKIEKIKNGDLDVYVNQQFSEHNTSERDEKISYIVLHYTGTILDAETIIKSYNFPSFTSASADFFISQKGGIYQYNPDIDLRYSWAVGGDKANNQGGQLHGVVTNSNSVSIELCVKNEEEEKANSDGWVITSETLDSAKKLIIYLMENYDIDINHVVRHYDVSGKLCPGVVGWNKDSGSDDDWLKFIEYIKENE